MLNVCTALAEMSQPFVLEFCQKIPACRSIAIKICCECALSNSILLQWQEMEDFEGGVAADVLHWKVVSSPLSEPWLVLDSTNLLPFALPVVPLHMQSIDAVSNAVWKATWASWTEVPSFWRQNWAGLQARRSRQMCSQWSRI